MPWAYNSALVIRPNTPFIGKEVNSMKEDKELSCVDGSLATLFWR